MQDLSNTNLNKSAVVVMDGGGYRAPGGPMSSPPVYRVHKADLSPRPSTLTSPATHLSSPFGDTGKYLAPEVLVNKSPSELPHGVDPVQREVGVELCFFSVI